MNALHTPEMRISVRRLRRIRRTVSLLALTLLVLALLVRTVAMPHRTEIQPMPLAYAYVPSPNFDDRPIDATISCIVLHATVEATTEGTMGIFLDPKKKVSAHFIVGKDGRVVQMVPVEKRAWHAGISTLDGAERVNDFSVGIEMVNKNSGTDPYPEAQMEAVAGLIRFVRGRYPVQDDHIVSHAQIALPAGRKSDPAGFDFERIKALARLGVAQDPARTSPRQQPSTLPPGPLDTKPSANP